MQTSSKINKNKMHIIIKTELYINMTKKISLKKLNYWEYCFHLQILDYIRDYLYNTSLILNTAFSSGIKAKCGTDNKSN